MNELWLVVPTFYGATYGDPELFRDKQEFDVPYVPIVVGREEGVRVVLGTEDFEDLDKPDIKIERRPNGWAIFLHPIGGGDPSGLVYFLDDGRSFLVPEGLSAESITVLDRDDDVPVIDDPPLPQVAAEHGQGDDMPPSAAAKLEIPTGDKRCANLALVSAALKTARAAFAQDSNDAEHDALFAMVATLEELELNLSAKDPPHPRTEQASPDIVVRACAS